MLCALAPADSLSPGTQFGHYTGLLFRLTGQDVALFRITGILLLLGTGFLFALALDAFLALKNSDAGDYSGKTGRVSVITLGVLAYYSPWMLTPSYNWLNLLSVLWAITALLRSGKSSNELPFVPGMTPSSLWGIVFGASCTLSFMARPVTALALSLLSLFWIFRVFPNKTIKPFLMISAGAALLAFALHLLLFEKGIGAYYAEMKAGLHLNSYFGAYTAQSIAAQAFKDLLQIPVRFIKILGGLTACLLAVNFLISRRPLSPKLHNWMIKLFCAAAWLILWIHGFWGGGEQGAWKNGFSGIAFCLGLALISWLAQKNPVWPKNPGQRELPVLLILACASFAISSDNGLVGQMSLAFGLLTAAAVVIAVTLDAGEKSRCRSGFVCLLLTACILMIFRGAYNTPYRLPASIGLQSEPIELQAARGKLRVDSKTKHYVDELQKAALRAGWRAGTPLIDLTESPGAAFILNAYAPVTPWLYGERYPGFTKAALEMAGREDLRRAWVLTTPEKVPQRTPEEVLKKAGLDFPEHYSEAGRFRTGFRNREQILWKPAH